MFPNVNWLQSYGPSKLVIKTKFRPFGFEATFFVILYSITVAPKITLRWYKLLPSATLAQDVSVDLNKTLSNSCSLISFKTIKILLNFPLTVANWSISMSRNLENIKEIKITRFREVQGHWDFFYINSIIIRHFSI